MSVTNRIKCEICEKYFKRIDNSHLKYTHNLSVEEYKNMYPTALLVSPELIVHLSNKTKNYFENLTNEDKRNRKSSYDSTSIEDRQTKINKMKEARLQKYDEIYGPNSIRNEKISIRKKEWWDSIPFEIRSEMLKKNKKIEIERRGELYYIDARKRAYHAYQCCLNKGKNKDRTSLEQYFLNILMDEHIDFIEQYELDGWYFDCYLPKYDTLLEFDGDFWHPKTLEDCKYNFQIENYKIAKEKNKYAHDNNYQLIRIYESNKHQFYNILEQIKVQC